MVRLCRRFCVLLCVWLLSGALTGCEGEPPGDDNVFPEPADAYTESDFENIRFRCTVSWDTESGETRKKELPKDLSIELYNLLDRAAWTSPEADPIPTERPILMLEFAAGDTARPKNCYGCVYLSDADYVVYTPSSVLGGLTPYVVPTGTYEAVWDKVSAAFGE